MSRVDAIHTAGRLGTWVGLGLLGACVSATPAAAQWDLSSSVTVNHDWSENAGFARGSNGDAVTAVRLMGRLAHTGPRVRFDSTYSPNGIYFRDNSDFNRVSHLVRLRTVWNLSARSTLTGTEAYAYTPEQGATSTTVNSPVVFTRYSDRKSNTLGLNYQFKASRQSNLAFDLRHNIQSFGQAGLVDSSGYSMGTTYNRQVSRKISVEAGGSFRDFSFENPLPPDPNFPMRDPGTETVGIEVVDLFAGGSLTFGPISSATARVGRSTVSSSDPARPDTNGTNASATVQWRWRSFGTNVGYHQGISTGSGTFDASKSQSIYGGVRADLTSDLSAEAILNRSTSKSANAGSGSVEALSGEVRVNYQMGRMIGVRAAVSRSTQSSSGVNAPDISFNRYSLGLIALFD